MSAKVSQSASQPRDPNHPEASDIGPKHHRSRSNAYVHPEGSDLEEKNETKTKKQRSRRPRRAEAE
jgi:hypothetical protein